MNTNLSSNATLFCDRRLNNAAAVRTTKPTRFSTEIEGEGAELFLRGLLVACLLAALAISNLGIGVGHREPSPAAAQNVVALAKPAVAPTDAPAAKL